MKKLKTNLSQLIEQNKNEILNDKNEMNKIEEKIDTLFQFFGLSGKTAWEDYYYKQKLRKKHKIGSGFYSSLYTIVGEDWETG